MTYEEGKPIPLRRKRKEKNKDNEKSLEEESEDEYKEEKVEVMGDTNKSPIIEIKNDYI
ncbi:25215_t:CDS:1, partial [Gigaspora margarita]